MDGKYVSVPLFGTRLAQGRDEWHPEHTFVWALTGVVDNSFVEDVGGYCV